MSSLDRIDEWGLNYIKKTRFYLKISAILPIYMIIIGIINLGFLSYMYIISIESRKVIPIHAIVVFTSFILIFLFSLMQFLFLRKWKLKIREYGKKIKLEKKDASDVSDDKSKNMVSIKISLTDIFYDVVNHMEKIKILFIIINFFSAIYIFYNFMIFIRLVIFVKKATLMTFETLRYLNLSVSIVLILYLIYMWYHFTKWNKKLKKLKNYEKMIGQELNL